MIRLLPHRLQSISSSHRSPLQFTSRLLSTSTQDQDQEKDQQDPTTHTHFGNLTLDINDKKPNVEKVFTSVASSYDKMNDFMSMGVHRLWKDHLINMLRLEEIGVGLRAHEFDHVDVPGTSADTNSDVMEFHHLDVAGGTGDIAFRSVDALGLYANDTNTNTNTNSSNNEQNQHKPKVSVTVLDINHGMLSEGQKKAQLLYGSSFVSPLSTVKTEIIKSKSSAINVTEDSPPQKYTQVTDFSKPLKFLVGDAENLHQFDDDTFNLYTIAFGLRNVTLVTQALKEAYRVLKPGGRMVVLEFSRPPNKIFSEVYDVYSYNVIPPLGEYIADDRESYQYLVESIRKFDRQRELKKRMESVGFKGVKYTNLSGGVVAIHEGWKI